MEHVGRNPETKNILLIKSGSFGLLSGTTVKEMSLGDLIFRTRLSELRRVVYATNFSLERINLVRGNKIRKSELWKIEKNDIFEQ